MIRESLRVDGQANPITVLEDHGQRWVLDGRTRRQEAVKIDMPLLAIVLTRDQVVDVDKWVAAKFRASAKSRRMTPSQLAILAADLVPTFEEKAKAHQKAGIEVPPEERGRSHEKAAKEVGASPSATRLALGVIKHPYIRGAVSNGGIPISVGAKIAGLPDEQKRKEALAAALKKDRALLDHLLERDIKATDQLGKALPPKLVELFRTAEYFRKFADELDAAADALEGVERSDDPSIISGVSIKAIRDLAAQIRDTIPYCVCKACEADGDECRLCEKRGWISEKRHAQWQHASRLCRG
jgi:hypothetical protein